MQVRQTNLHAYLQISFEVLGTQTPRRFAQAGNTVHSGKFISRLIH